MKTEKTIMKMPMSEVIKSMLGMEQHIQNLEREISQMKKNEATAKKNEIVLKAKAYEILVREYCIKQDFAHSMSESVHESIVEKVSSLEYLEQQRSKDYFGWYEDDDDRRSDFEYPRDYHFKLIADIDLLIQEEILKAKKRESI